MRTPNQQFRESLIEAVHKQSFRVADTARNAGFLAAHDATLAGVGIPSTPERKAERERLDRKARYAQEALTRLVLALYRANWLP